MIYNEQYQQCSSSIITRLCPSNVNKSTQPCPLLSLSPVSSSSITHRSLLTSSIRTDRSLSSPFYIEHERNIADVLSSSSSSAYLDYHTSKRIERLHERMDDIQISSFLKFINYHLSTKYEDNLVKDLTHDLSNGHILLDLIEIFSSTKLKRERGRTRFHALTNVQYVLDYLKLHMQHIHISPHEIVSGNRKQILALLWIIMKIFDFPSFRITTNKHVFHEHTLLTCGQDRSILLKWTNHLLNKICQFHVKDFYLSTWIEHVHLTLIVKYLSALSQNSSTLEYFQCLTQLDRVDLTHRERFDLTLHLSMICFSTNSTIDYTDRTEKSLLRYFSQLQQHIFHLYKNGHIGNLHGNNLYTKDLLETLTETMTIGRNIDLQ
jgi:hypothetical protein